VHELLLRWRRLLEDRDGREASATRARMTADLMGAERTP